MERILAATLLLMGALPIASAGKWSSANCTGINTRDDCGHGSCEIYETFNNSATLQCQCDDAYLDRGGVCNYRQKTLTSAFLYSFFLGGFGGDYFYLANGNPAYLAIGCIKGVTLGGLAVWQVIDFIRLMAGDMKDGQGIEIFNDFSHATANS
mmetsp:Transcript_18716/g.35331  ORF Transcript_18716/g.35331 Transcript_18716/m.35331 type:complete len:153 (-) Transcript_18716:182-640(-)|eukprot:CAMPEP_0170189222 /NCGR_PEP_ID=MMETSP0040_2-20121228/46284_1 /TAXON_ID=641309 /ORGANISM="Lotharella oceanica, Strain CCMP622" /LENGTH=152 /DNA_ID=CAMNT_0010436721 /DNA_START=196 /DNA_END=654 /DNA_ORIENTATION=+